MTRVFIGTLYSGEAELQECKLSIEAQSIQTIKHELISFLPNKEAHDKLYSRFMELNSQYDYFIKLDADMVFRDTKAVEKIIKYFKQRDSLDHLILSVHDFYTNRSVIGVHIFSNRCIWNLESCNIFVDHDPSIVGTKEMYSCANPIDNLVTHAFNQRPEDAASYGAHKTTKIIQNGIGKYNYPQLANHWNNINQVINNYCVSNNSLCYLAITSFCANLNLWIEHSETVNQDSYKSYSHNTPNQTENVDLFIHSKLYRISLLYRVIRLKKLLNMCLFMCIKKIKKSLRVREALEDTPLSLTAK